MTSEASVKEFHDKAINAWGYLDAAVNNVNVLGVFWSMQHQLRHMESRGTGRIINLASIAGRRGILYQGSYVATKHARRPLSSMQPRALRSPGAIKTNILHDAIKAGKYSEESITTMFPANRMGVPDDIARTVSYILDSPYMTGSVIGVDGGFCA
ncbi:hypothetical protein EDB80DRAFT_752944 [Ilyonectria destructans]|nr:hypothetical protein EDB80DRAFT_752944 [Ilyonectria destructans]